MSEQSATNPAPKRPYNRRAPLRAEPVRVEAAREEEVRPKKVRTRKGGGTDRLHIPPEMIPDGIDLQWVTDAVLGQPSPQTRMSYEVNAWEPVTGGMFEGRFDGMFMKKGHEGEINYEGLVLMWRPMELTLEARAEERAAALQAVGRQEAKLKSGQLDGVSFDTQHPSARANTRLTKERIPSIAVPR